MHDATLLSCVRLRNAFRLSGMSASTEPMQQYFSWHGTMKSNEVKRADHSKVRCQGYECKYCSCICKKYAYVITVVWKVIYELPTWID